MAVEPGRNGWRTGFLTAAWAEWLVDPVSRHGVGSAGESGPVKDGAAAAEWLGDLDSNQECPSQSREFYR